MTTLVDLAASLEAIRARYPGDDPLDTLAQRVVDEVAEAMRQASEQNGGDDIWPITSQLRASRRQASERPCPDGFDPEHCPNSMCVRDGRCHAHDTLGKEERREPMAWYETSRGTLMVGIVYQAWRKKFPDQDRGFVPLYAAPRPEGDTDDHGRSLGDERSGDSGLTGSVSGEPPALSDAQRELAEVLAEYDEITSHADGSREWDFVMRAVDWRIVRHALAQRGARDGWVLVPKEPTEHMLEIGSRAIDSYYDGTKDAPFGGSLAAAYKAMVEISQCANCS